MKIMSTNEKNPRTHTSSLQDDLNWDPTSFWLYQQWVHVTIKVKVNSLKTTTPHYNGPKKNHGPSSYLFSVCMLAITDIRIKPIEHVYPLASLNAEFNCIFASEMVMKFFQRYNFMSLILSQYVFHKDLIVKLIGISLQ